MRDGWQEVLSHSEDGTVLSGSVDKVAEASMRGCEIKVGIRDLGRDLSEVPNMDHKWFVQAHSNYYYTEQKLLITGTQPIVRLRPAIPLTYTSGAWDCGRLMGPTGLSPACSTIRISSGHIAVKPVMPCDGL